jgi:hypothetical protein
MMINLEISMITNDYSNFRSYLTNTQALQTI